MVAVENILEFCLVKPIEGKRDRKMCVNKMLVFYAGTKRSIVGVLLNIINVNRMNI